MGVKNKGGIPDKHFKQIDAALGNFYERHPSNKSAQIQDVANSTNSRRFIEVTVDVHSHAPFLATTKWFTFTMTDGDHSPEEFHVYVNSGLWPDVLLLEKVSNGDPAFAGLTPPPPGPPPTSVGSFWNPLLPVNLTWF